MSRVLFTLLAGLGILLFANAAMAGAILPIGDDASLNFGYRIQSLMVSTDADLDGDNKFDTSREWKLRRARFRLGATIGDHFTAFLQTDAGSVHSEVNNNKVVQVIDAWVNFTVSPWLQFIAGRNMAPANRQNLTSSGALMAIDRTGMAYKSLTWGARAAKGFATGIYGQSSTNIALSPDLVRDNGLTIFGSGPLGANSLKYYVGMYNGVQAGTDDKDRFTARVQYNLWDPEAAYFNSSTYLGSKKTLGIGFSYDMQEQVGFNSDGTTPLPPTNPWDPATPPTVHPTQPLADYTYMTFDVFLELPNSAGNALTVETGWMTLDMNDAGDYLNTQGSGFYGQAGYYLASGWQPWVEFESFDSDAAADADGKKMGTYTNMRIGLTYYLEGQHANIKLGYEAFKSDQAIITAGDGSTGTEDTINTITLGFYTTY